jgi:hypothetical protein
MDTKAKKEITSTKPISSSNTHKVHFWPAIRLFSDEQLHQQSENHRARVMWDRQSIEGCDAPDIQAGDFGFFIHSHQQGEFALTTTTMVNTIKANK